MKHGSFRKTAADLLHTDAPAPRLRLPPVDTAFLVIVLIISGTVNAPQAISIGMSGLGAWTFGMALLAAYLWLTRFYFPRSLFHVFFPLALFCLYGALSAIWGGSSLHTYQLLAVTGGFLSLALITARECDADLRLVGRLNAAMDIASVTAAVAYTLVVLVYGSAGEAYLGTRPLFLARPFALFACMAVARQLARWHARDGGHRGLTVAVWLTALVFLSQSRTAMLICLALFPLSFAVQGTTKSILTGIGMAIVGAFVMTAAIFLYQPLYDRMFKYDASMKVGGVAINASGRTQIWDALWHDISGSQWLFGHGLGAASRFLDLLFTNIGHPHNEYLRFLYDVGLVGLVLYVLHMIVAIGLMWGGVLRTAGKFPAQLAVHLGPLLGFFVLVIAMATDNPIIYVYLMAPLAIMTGCSMCLIHRERRHLNAGTWDADE